MKKILRDLKEFASQRVIVDISLGIIIGAAISDFVNVFVKEIILPPISYFTKGMNLENKSVVLREAGSVDGIIPLEDVAIGYGKMIEVSIDFLVIALVLFILYKTMGKLWRRTPVQALESKQVSEREAREVALLEETVSLLRRQNELLENHVHKD